MYATMWEMRRYVVGGATAMSIRVARSVFWKSFWRQQLANYIRAKWRTDLCLEPNWRKSPNISSFYIRK